MTRSVRKTLHAQVIHLIRRLNYETYLLQYGILRWLRRGPFMRIAPAAAVLAVLWACYWLLYPLGLICAALLWPLAQLNQSGSMR